MGEEPADPDQPDCRVSPRAAQIARRQRVLHGVSIGIGVGVALVGTGLLAIAAAELVTGGGGKTAPASHVGLIVVFAAMIWWGLQLGWPELAPRPLARRLLARRSAGQGLISGPPGPAVPEDADREHAVLQLAEKEQGRLTVLEAAGRCDLTVDQAKALLDGLVLRKVAQMQVSEAGVLVYVFARFLPGPGRSRRRRGVKSTSVDE
jgi:hypothetical protein